MLDQSVAPLAARSANTPQASGIRGGRSEKAGRRKLIQRLRSPLALRVPLFDPDRLLDLTLPLVRPLFTAFGFLAWLGLVMAGVILAILHWPELTSDVADRVLAAENVALL